MLVTICALAKTVTNWLCWKINDCSFTYLLFKYVRLKLIERPSLNWNWLLHWIGSIGWTERMNLVSKKVAEFQGVASRLEHLCTKYTASSFRWNIASTYQHGSTFCSAVTSSQQSTIQQHNPWHAAVHISQRYAVEIFFQPAALQIMISRIGIRLAITRFPVVWSLNLYCHHVSV